MNEWMTCVKIPKITGLSEKEDMEEDVDAARNDKKMKLIKMKHWYCWEDENHKDHKCIPVQVVAMLTQVAETWKCGASICKGCWGDQYW